MTNLNSTAKLLSLLFISFLLPSLLQADYFRIYEDKDFKGDSYYVDLDDVVDGQLYSLKSTDVHDEMSSVKWDLSYGSKVIFYEHSDGTGRVYIINGGSRTSDSDTHNNDFKDCASSWRFMGGYGSIPATFHKVRTSAETVKFSKNGKTFPDGGHMQGIQQLDSRHVVVSGSSKETAYFFIIEWDNAISTDETGKVITVHRINDDFGSGDNFDYSHAGGIQLTESILAIGTEKEKGEGKGSNVLFYDLSNVYNPVRVGDRIFRSSRTAGAIGIVKQSSNYLLVVADWGADVIDFYTSNTLDLTSSYCDFGSPDKTWMSFPANLVPNMGSSRTGWIDGNWGSYQGLNVLRDPRDPDGQLYLVGFNNDGGRDWADLYSLDISAPEATMLKKIDKKHVYCEDGAHFLYSGGLYAPSFSHIDFWATEKHFHTETKLNRFRFHY